MLAVFGLRLEMEVSDRLVYVSITPLFQIKMMMSPPALHHLHLQQVGNHDDPSSSNHCLQFFTNAVAIKIEVSF